ncbi:hypothetical protein AB0G42_32125 [Streptomyces yangpuensis]|uniref:restriction endonuclease-related protein n=1 Tax=Streptomyces yangpuensis TaxID=1648182 RepID=UPI003442937B
MTDQEARERVMKAAARAVPAFTAGDGEPTKRLQTLMDAHGEILAARGPAHPLTFSGFLDSLTGDLAGLLPAGVEPEELEGVHLIDPDGYPADELFDITYEQQMVLDAVRHKTRRDGSPPTIEELDGELDQVIVNEVLRQTGRQDDYVNGRRNLSTVPSGTEEEITELGLPARIFQFYKPIDHAALFEQWWFACPFCRWPMKVTVHGRPGERMGRVRCLYPAHAETLGAHYMFSIPEVGAPPVLLPTLDVPRLSAEAKVLAPEVRGEIPVAVPAAGHWALKRGPWRYTTVPGLTEIALFEVLRERGVHVDLWPDLDSYDIRAVPATPCGEKVEFRIDIKDFTSGFLLGEKIRRDKGDKGGAKWIVVPDYRHTQLPYLRGVCDEYGLRVATATVMGKMICETAGVRWV